MTDHPNKPNCSTLLFEQDDGLKRVGAASIETPGCFVSSAYILKYQKGNMQGVTPNVSTEYDQPASEPAKRKSKLPASCVYLIPQRRCQTVGTSPEGMPSRSAWQGW